MASFAEKFQALRVESGSAALVWLGQAGFLLKTTDGAVIAIDPYLSDFVYHSFRERDGLAYKRLTAPLFQPGELHLDAVLCTHEHGDHLDLESLPALLRGGTPCYTNGPGAEKLLAAGADVSCVHELRKGDRVDLGGIGLLAVDCDHGSLAPEALGFLLDFGFLRLYDSGDTALTPERLGTALTCRPEVGLLPINGAFGNLNGREAAQLAAQLGLRLCIPHHFWTFAAHGGDPMAAIREFRELAPDCELRLLTPGEICILRNDVDRARSAARKPKPCG